MMCLHLLNVGKKVCHNLINLILKKYLPLFFLGSQGNLLVFLRVRGKEAGLSARASTWPWTWVKRDQRARAQPTHLNTDQSVSLVAEKDTQHTRKPPRGSRHRLGNFWKKTNGPGRKFGHWTWLNIYLSKRKKKASWKKLLNWETLNLL